MNDIKLYPNFHSIYTDKNYCIVLGGRGLGKTYTQEQALQHRIKETINRMYGKEGSGEMKRYKISYETHNGNGCWYEIINDKNGEGHTEQDILDAFTKGFFRSGIYQNIQVDEVIPKSELFEELFFIQYVVYGKQRIEVDFFTNFRDFCYHIVKISSDHGDIVNVDKVAATRKGVFEGFFLDVNHNNKKFKELYKIVDVEGKRYFSGLKA